MKTGERLLTATVDSIADADPTRTCFVIPDESSEIDYIDISYKRFANSINRLAWHLKQTIGVSDQFETVCYLGPPDLLYFVFALAACKCGFKALFTSPRNSIEAHVNLLQTTSCHTLFGPKSATVSSILSQYTIDHKTLAPLEHWLDETPSEHFRDQRSFHELAEHPFIVLHTSGTTGLPKPVDITHGLVSTVDSYQDLSPVDNKEIWLQRVKNKRILCCLPPFHSAGTNFLIFAIFFGAILVLPPASQPPDLRLVEAILDKGLAKAGCMAPSILEEIVESDVLKKLSAWDFVAFGGSPLAKAAGDKLWDVTKVFNLLGSTETYVLPELEPDTKDEWQYHAFHPSLGLDFQQRSTDRFEAGSKWKESSAMFQGCFKTFKDKSIYPMGDLYSQHPSKSGLWLYRGRADDIIVLSNGEKFNPQDLEAVVSSHPDVQAVLTVGEGRTQPALLVEARKSLSELPSTSQQVDRLWDVVAEANESLPKHAQIDREHVAVLAPDDEFPRSSKGAVQRRPTLIQKQDLIDSLYNSADSKQSYPFELNFETLDTLRYSLVTGIQATCQALAEIDTDANFFESGMDSLQAMRLARKLRNGLESVPNLPDQFPKPALIYECPTVERLARTLMSLASGESLPPTPQGEQDDTLNEMQAARKRYAYDGSQFRRPTQPFSDRTVILTGSTGRLGSYLLHSLLSDERVCKVHCLGRSSAEQLYDRQLESQREKGLCCNFDRVAFHKFDVRQECWGLDHDLVDELSKHTTHIIHNAWPVNFNHTFSSFDAQLQGCQTLMALASRCSLLENLLFVSSVGAANNYEDREMSEVPEEAITDMLTAEAMGYAQSKLVAELLFIDASKGARLPTTICRVGQIAGPAQKESGSWNRDEWFPSLMITSKTTGQIPTSLGAMDDIDWLPSDILGDVLTQMTFSEAETSDARVLHAVNPRRVRWSTLLAELQKSKSLGNMKQVGLSEWLATLRTISSDASASLEKMPAVKLLEFYEMLEHGQARPIFSTLKGTASSEALRDVSHIESQWLERWIGQWFNDN